jgi:hypothetical protein
VPIPQPSITRQHRRAQVGRQIEQLADHQRRRDHRREHDQYVLQPEQQRGENAGPVLKRVAQRKDGHAAAVALPGHGASCVFCRRNDRLGVRAGSS